jgi:hypothetical protein
MKIRNQKLTSTSIYLLVGASFLIALYALDLKYPGQILFSLLKAALLITAIFIYGFFILSLLKNNIEKIDFPTAFAVGLMFTTFFFFLVSFFKFLVPAVIFFFYLLPVVLLLYIIKSRKPAIQHTLFSFFNRSPLEYPAFFLPFIYASLPSTFYDTLVYHLGIPNLYLQHGGFLETPQFLFANTSIYYETSLIPAVFAGDPVPRLFHFLIGVIFILAAADFAKEIFGIKKRSMFILLALAMPMSIFLLSTVKSDLTGAFFILLAVRYLLKHRFGLSALFWGFSIGIKYFNALPMMIFLVIFLVKEKQFSIKKLLLFGMTAAATVSPLLIKNFIYAGNPFFPFFSQYFKSEYWDASRYALMASDVGKMFHSVIDALKFPYTLSFHHSGFGGMVGAQFLIFLPFLLIIKDRLKKKWYFLLFAVLAIYIGGNFTASVRFLYIAFLFFTFYLAVIYESVTQKIVKYLFYIVIAFNFVISLSLQEQMYRSFQLLSGRMDSETYKAAMFPTYPAIAYVNQHPPPQTGTKPRVLLVGEARNYYLKLTYILASGVDYSILKEYLDASTTFEQFITNLQKDNIYYIIFNTKEFDRLQKGYRRLNQNELNQMASFIEHLQPNIVFHKKSTFVFLIKSFGEAFSKASKIPASPVRGAKR